MEQINNRKDERIAILMATYNGKKFLSEQIDSILSQSNKQWHLYIHDDGSTDGTVELLKDYTDKYPECITVMDYSSQGGAMQNFMSLLEKVKADYYMFSDQDDVWLPHKIEREYEKIKELESNNPRTPIIVHTDLVVVNENLNTINKSFWEYEKIFPKAIQTYRDYAAVNCVTGCTMLFNKETKEAINTPLHNAIMHDAWITLSIAAVGGIVYPIEEQSILYRQHSDNTLGARDANLLTWRYKLLHYWDILNANKQHYRQMNAIKKITWAEFIAAKVRYKNRTTQNKI